MRGQEGWEWAGVGGSRAGWIGERVYVPGAAHSPLTTARRLRRTKYTLDFESFYLAFAPKCLGAGKVVRVNISWRLIREGGGRGRQVS